MRSMIATANADTGWVKVGVQGVERGKTTAVGQTWSAQEKSE